MNAVKQIRATAKIEDSDLCNEIVDLDLYAKEFKYQVKCYNSFTYGYKSSMRNR